MNIVTLNSVASFRRPTKTIVLANYVIYRLKMFIEIKSIRKYFRIALDWDLPTGIIILFI